MTPPPARGAIARRDDEARDKGAGEKHLSHGKFDLGWALCLN